MRANRLDRNWLAMGSIFAVALGVRLAYWLYQGTIVGNDDYTAVCSLWFSDPVAALGAHKGILYSGFTFPFCSVLSIPGATFETWIAVQIVLASLSCVLLYRAARALVDFETGVVAGLALALLWDTFYWDVAVLSDSMSTIAVVVAVWALVRFQRAATTENRLLAFLALGYVGITRPHGVAIVLGWVAFDLYWREDRRLGLFEHRVVPATLLAATPAVVPYVIERYGLYQKWQAGWIVVKDSSLFVYDIPAAGDGSVVDFVLGNAHHLVAMGILKMAFFFAPWVPRHSTANIVVSSLTMLPIYAIGAVGIYWARRNHYPLYRLCIGPIVAMLLVTAITFVSYDFRYRAPLGPLFALAFAYAITTQFDGFPLVGRVRDGT